MTERRLYEAAEMRADMERRTLVGWAVPFGPAIDLGGYRERFVSGAFTRTIRERSAKVKLLVQHSSQTLPIGRATKLEERSEGLWAEFAVSKTAAGDEALELVRDGALDSFSVGFRPVRDRVAGDGVVERTEVKLLEVSVVGLPAYEGAEIVGVRSLSPNDRLGVARSKLTLLEMKR